MSNDNRMKADDAYLPEMSGNLVEKALAEAHESLDGLSKLWLAARDSLGREISALRAEVRRLQAMQPAPVLLARPEGHGDALRAVSAERVRQELLWGPQDNHTFGCENSEKNQLAEEAMRYRYSQAVASQTLTWMDILDEEVAELRNTNSYETLYKEAIQVSAVALAIAEQAKRRIK